MASFLPPVQPLLETAPQLGTTCAFQVGTAQLSLGIVPGTTHIHLTPLVGVRGCVESHEIETNVETRYFRFKGMSYKNESYLCDINCVQLRKALTRF